MVLIGLLVSTFITEHSISVGYTLLSGIFSATIGTFTGQRKNFDVPISYLECRISHVLEILRQII